MLLFEFIIAMAVFPQNNILLMISWEKIFLFVISIFMYD